jgi:predicted RNA-binding protein
MYEIATNESFIETPEIVQIVEIVEEMKKYFAYRIKINNLKEDTKYYLTVSLAKLYFSVVFCFFFGLFLANYYLTFFSFYYF